MTTTSRDEIPDYAIRARRLAELSVAPVLPVADIAVLLDVPLRTMDALRAEGRGPKCFHIGKRLYVRRSDLLLWIDEMAAAAA